MKVLIMSDIHGNKNAFQAVLDHMSNNSQDIKACILLGDLIDYGMHSNEVIQMINILPYPIICNIRGNHEDAVLRDEYSRFSSERGRISAKYTKSILDQTSWNYINSQMSLSGLQEFEYSGKKCLAVHGSMVDEYWNSIKPDDLLTEYEKYDYVFSGHSHQPHYFEKYYKVEDPVHRNMKKTIFINPGSIGQPRNHNPMAQYALLDMNTEEIQFCKVEYDISSEQSSFTDKVDIFYRERLAVGI